MTAPTTVTTADGAAAVLADPLWQVAEPTADDRVATLSWLRASVSRFANGDEHRERRACIEHELAAIDPVALRADASRRTHAAIAALPGATVQVMELARVVPSTALAAALRAEDPERAAVAVSAVAAGYFPGSPVSAEERADVAVPMLLAEFDVSRAAALARVTALVQSCDATAALIGSAAVALAHDDSATDELLVATMRRHSPVRGIRRVQDGAVTVCDVDAANVSATGLGLGFGAGIRPCPGVPHALALAAGVVDALRAGCRSVEHAGDYEDSPLRIPRGVVAHRR